MSSVDLHGQYSYQALLPEAIAIVVAPRYQPKYFTATLCLPTRARAQSYIRLWCSFGIFALTELGMEMIGQVRALAGALDLQVPLSHMCLVGGAV